MQSLISLVYALSLRGNVLTQVVVKWEFDMYIAGNTPKSVITYNNLMGLCQQYLGSKCVINIIDLTKNPEIAAEKQITAIPTIIRKKPEPERILIGNLSNIERVIAKLDLKSHQSQVQGTMVSYKGRPFFANSKLLSYKPALFNFKFK